MFTMEFGYDALQGLMYSYAESMEPGKRLPIDNLKHHIQLICPDYTDKKFNSLFEEVLAKNPEFRLDEKDPNIFYKDPKSKEKSQIPSSL